MKNSSSRNFSMIFFFNIIVKVLGFFKSILIAREFGSDGSTDLYYFALSIVTILTSFIGGALNQSIIPIVQEIEYKQGKKEKLLFISNVVNIFIILSLVIIVILWIFTPQILNLLSFGNYNADELSVLVKMVRIGMPSILIYNVTGVYRGYLQSEKLFFETAIINIPFNLVYITYLLFFASLYGLIGLMIVHLLAVLSQYLVQQISLYKTDYQYTFILNPKDSRIKETIITIAPLFVSIAFNDINLMVDKSMAAGLSDGVISALEYGNRINVLILQLFVAALTAVIFPNITDYYFKRNFEKVTSTIEKGIDLLILIIVPTTMLVIVFRKEIIYIMYERGAFDRTATLLTSSAMFYYSLGIFASSVKSILFKLFYAMKDMKTPMYTSIIGTIINIILNVVLVQVMDFKGLALATSLSSYITLTYLLIVLYRQNWKLKYKRITFLTIQFFLLMVPMGFVTRYIYNNVLNLVGISRINIVAIALFIGGVAFLISIFVFIVMSNIKFSTLKKMFRK